MRGFIVHEKYLAPLLMHFSVVDRAPLDWGKGECCDFGVFAPEGLLTVDLMRLSGVRCPPFIFYFIFIKNKELHKLFVRWAALIVAKSNGEG